jgi:ApaG protein
MAIIRVDTQVQFEPDQSQMSGHKSEHQFLFSYKIEITNMTSKPAQLMSRHWIITDAVGRTEEVQGPGVVGEQPLIAPGETFTYQSFCPLPTNSGTMKGSYSFKSDSGELFQVPISEFHLIAPSALH